MKIESISNHLFNLLNLPISLYSGDKNIRTFQSYSVPNKLYNIIESNRNQLVTQTDEQYIYRLTDFSKLSYFSFHLDNTLIVIGPYLEEEIKGTIITSLSGRLRMLKEDIKLVEQFYNSLIVLNNEEIGLLIDTFSSLNSFNTTQKSYQSVESLPVKHSKEIDLENLFVELEYVKHNYDIEDRLSSVIESGNIDTATSFPTKEIMKELPKRARYDSLRNAKTRLTILNTLCNRSAIRGGVDIQLGHQISTNFGIIIESMKSIHDSDSIAKDIAITYTSAVQNYSLKNYSKTLRSAVLLIRQNITMKYSLNELSEDLFISKEHLSRLFRKELNMTVSEYIGHIKIIEAKKLLSLKGYSISEVSNALGFTNYSYFTKIFKHHTNLSPRQYKKAKEST